MLLLCTSLMHHSCVRASFSPCLPLCPHACFTERPCLSRQIEWVHTQTHSVWVVQGACFFSCCCCCNVHADDAREIAERPTGERHRSCRPLNLKDGRERETRTRGKGEGHLSLPTTACMSGLICLSVCLSHRRSLSHTSAHKKRLKARQKGEPAVTHFRAPAPTATVKVPLRVCVCTCAQGLLSVSVCLSVSRACSLAASLDQCMYAFAHILMSLSLSFPSSCLPH